MLRSSPVDMALFEGSVRADEQRGSLEANDPSTPRLGRASSEPMLHQQPRKSPQPPVSWLGNKRVVHASSGIGAIRSKIYKLCRFSRLLHQNSAFSALICRLLRRYSPFIAPNRTYCAAYCAKPEPSSSRVFLELGEVALVFILAKKPWRRQRTHCCPIRLKRGRAAPCNEDGYSVGWRCLLLFTGNGVVGQKK
jgi:hypothetical protein